MKRYSLSLGASIGYAHPHPERTAQRNGPGMFPDVVFQVWPSRAAMLKTIELQRRGDPDHLRASGGAWSPLVKD